MFILYRRLHNNQVISFFEETQFIVTEMRKISLLNFIRSHGSRISRVFFLICYRVVIKLNYPIKVVHFLFKVF